jgi:integrase
LDCGNPWQRSLSWEAKYTNMALKNLVRKKVFLNGRLSWQLETPDGQLIHAFTVFCRNNRQFKAATRKRYAEAVARFLDYLYEALTFGHGAVSADYLNNVVETYLELICDGSERTLKRINECGEQSSDDIWLVRVAQALRLKPLMRSSLSNIVPAINRFLEQCELLSKEEFDWAQLCNPTEQFQHQSLFDRIHGKELVTRREVAQIGQYSVFGSMSAGQRHPTRQKRLKVKFRLPQEDSRSKPFPGEYLSRLIDSSNSWRDKTTWLGMATYGIRGSEARNMLLDDIDFKEQRVWVMDPSGRRGGSDELRFKGRATAETYAIPQLKHHFFRALENYLNFEYVPLTQPGEPRYLLQYIDSGRRGQPFVNASDHAFLDNFKSAAKKAGVPLSVWGDEWGPHSLRHFYGDFLLNYFPFDIEHGVFGLPLEVVQKCMGHARIRSTQKYAKLNANRIMNVLQRSDEAYLALTPAELKRLPGGLSFA